MRLFYKWFEKYSIFLQFLSDMPTDLKINSRSILPKMTNQPTNPGMCTTLHTTTLEYRHSLNTLSFKSRGIWQ